MEQSHQEMYIHFRNYFWVTNLLDHLLLVAVCRSWYPSVQSTGSLPAVPGRGYSSGFMAHCSGAEPEHVKTQWRADRYTDTTKYTEDCTGNSSGYSSLMQSEEGFKLNQWVMLIKPLMFIACLKHLQDELTERSVQLEKVRKAGKVLTSPQHSPKLKTADINTTTGNYISIFHFLYQLLYAY